MDKKLQVSESIEIKAEPNQIWEVLTNPEKIKTYLFGTETITDWEVGSSIIFKGEYQGKKYSDKGNVLEKEKGRLLKYDYWSGFSGLEDKPENYSIVTFRIEKLTNNKVKFIWTQEGFASEESKSHTQQSLGQILQQIKNLAEG